MDKSILKVPNEFFFIVFTSIMLVQQVALFMASRVL